MNKRHVLLLTAVLGMASVPAFAQTQPAPTNAAAVVKDPQLSAAPVSINTGTYRGPLSVLLSAVAKSAGYDLVFNFNVDALALVDGSVIASASAATPAAPAGQTGATPASAPAYASATGRPEELSAKPIAYSFNKRPFNEVWPLLMDVYELQYEVVNLGSGQVLRISQRPAQLAIPLRYITAKYAEAKALEFFGQPSYTELPIYDNNGKIVDKVRQFDKYVLTSNTMRVLADVENNRVIAGGTSEESSKIRSFISTIDIPKVANVAVPEGRSVYDAKSSAADINNVLKSQYPDLKVTPVGQSSQLIISGPQAQLTAALELLSKVDQAAPAKAGAVQKVFQLVNASAEELKATLEGTLARDLAAKADNLASATLLDPVTGTPYSGTLANAPMNQQTPAPSATPAVGTATATAPAEQPVTIIADKRTNTLVVRGSQTQVDQVAELIPQLDKVVPQVNVQVRIQEITEKAMRSLGLDWKLNFGGFQVKVGGTGLGATFDPTQSLVGFNIFPTLTALEEQSLAKKVYDGSITMQSGQRSIGNNSPTQNASSTAAASIKSGGRLEINIPSAAANVPAIQKQIDYGVNLDFFDPQVAPDGTITLRVRGQVSDPNTVIAGNTLPNIIDFSNSEAQSIVTFKSGQTLLLTGLMGSKNKSTTGGVPYLSSIPVIGAAFGKQGYDNTATQLLVVITGTVVK